MTATPVALRPSTGRIRDRIAALTADDPELAIRFAGLREYSHGIRTTVVFATTACNIRCRGCWYYGHDLDKGVTEVTDPKRIEAFAADLARQGTSHVLLIGGEPTLVPERVSAYASHVEHVTVTTNGLRALPREGFENVNVAVSVFGGGPLDDELRGIRPNGSRMTGLFERALENYRDDPRAVFIYALAEDGIGHIADTVELIGQNGNQVTFGFYSAYGTGDPVGLAKGQDLLTEALRVREAHAETVVSHPYYIRTLITGRSHWAPFGYDVCATLTTAHPAHADRLANGHPTLPGFAAYQPDLTTLQSCCTSGDCDGCRDSQAVHSWLLVNLHQFLDTSDMLRTWVEIAESFYGQYYWSPYHRARRS